MIDSGSPVVTICIPSFNRHDVISETLESLSRQTYQRWEAIIVDDGSTDSVNEVIAEYAMLDARIRLLKRDRGPKGACTCRNIAVGAARGRYVLFLDTDDLLAPYCLEQRTALLETQPQLDFAIFPMLLFKDDPGNADRLWNIDTGEDDLVRLLRLDPVCQGTGTLWRKDSFIRIGMWNEALHVWQDIELHLRAFTSDMCYVRRLDLRPDVLLRESDASLSRGSYQSREKLESRAAVARKAAELLRSSGKSDLLSHVRYFCSSVAMGASGSNNLDIARDMREWGLREGVLTPAEARRLRLAEVVRMSRLDRFAPGRAIREKIARHFSAPSALGQVHFNQAQV